MAFGGTHLYLLGPGAPGFNKYLYRTSDTMASVLDINGDGYFDNGPDAAPKLAVNDLIECLCADGRMNLKVSAVNATTGVVTVQYAGGNLPIRTWATGTAAGDFGMSPGFYEVGTSIATGTRGILPVPYPGVEVAVFKVDSGTETFAFDAGACASNISWVDGTVGGGTHVTFDGTNRQILLRAEGDFFRVVGSGDGSTGAGRYRITSFFFSGSAVSEGASVELKGT